MMTTFTILNFSYSCLYATLYVTKQKTVLVRIEHEVDVDLLVIPVGQVYTDVTHNQSQEQRVWSTRKRWLYLIQTLPHLYYFKPGIRISAHGNVQKRNYAQSAQLKGILIPTLIPDILLPLYLWVLLLSLYTLPPAASQSYDLPANLCICSINDNRSRCVLL